MAKNPTNWTQLGVFACDRCPFKTSDSALWQQHKFICRPTIKHTASISYDRTSDNFFCSLCNVWLRRPAFREHLERHITQKPYSCPHCQNQFSTRAETYVHAKQYHAQVFNLHGNGKDDFALRVSQKSEKLMSQAENLGKVVYKPLNKNTVDIPFGPTGRMESRNDPTATICQTPSIHTQGNHIQSNHTHATHAQASRTQSIHTQATTRAIHTHAGHSQASHTKAPNPQAFYTQGIHTQAMTQAIHTYAGHSQAFHTKAPQPQAFHAQAIHTRVSHTQAVHNQVPHTQTDHQRYSHILSSFRILKPRPAQTYGSSPFPGHPVQPLAPHPPPRDLNKHSKNSVAHEPVIHPMNCANFVSISRRASSDSAATPSPPLVSGSLNSLPVSRSEISGDLVCLQSVRGNGATCTTPAWGDGAICSTSASNTTVGSDQWTWHHQTGNSSKKKTQAADVEDIVKKETSTERVSCIAQTEVKEETRVGEQIPDHVRTDRTKSAENMESVKSVECIDKDRAPESVLRTKISECVDETRANGSMNNNRVAENIDNTVAADSEDRSPIAETSSSSRVGLLMKHYCYFKGHYICIKCQYKWSGLDGCLFIKHVWSHIHETKNFTCCSGEFSIECKLLERQLSEILKNSLDVGFSDNLKQAISSFKEKVSESTSDTMDSFSSSFYQCGFHDCIFASDTPVDLLMHNESAHGHDDHIPCVYCGKLNRKPSGLLDHMNTHIGNESKEVISVSFFWEKREKFEVQHKELKRVIDTVQNSVSKKMDKQRDTPVKYKCNLCDAIFNDLKSLESHLKKETLKVLSCKYCRAHFLTSAACKSHMSLKHPKEPKRYSTTEKLLCKSRIENQYHNQLEKRKKFRAAHYSQKKGEESASTQTNDKANMCLGSRDKSNSVTPRQSDTSCDTETNDQANMCLGSSDKSNSVTPGQSETSCDIETNDQTNMCLGSSDKSNSVTPGQSDTSCETETPAEISSEFEAVREPCPSPSSSQRSCSVHDILKANLSDSDLQLGSARGHKEVEDTLNTETGVCPLNENQGSRSAENLIHSSFVGSPGLATEPTPCELSSENKGSSHIGKTSNIVNVSTNSNNPPKSVCFADEVNRGTSLVDQQNTGTVTCPDVQEDLSKGSKENTDFFCLSNHQLQIGVKELKEPKVSQDLCIEGSVSHSSTSFSSEKTSNAIHQESDTVEERVEKLIDRVHFKCSLCSKQFSSYFVGRMHTREHIAQSAKLVRIRNASFNVRSHAFPAFEATKKYKCRHCALTLIGVESKLKQHLHSHKFFKCGHCSKTYGFLKYMKNHWKYQHHSQIEKYKMTCPSLKESFSLAEWHTSSILAGSESKRKRHNSTKLAEDSVDGCHEEQNSHSYLACGKKRKTVCLRETSSNDFETPVEIRMDKRLFLTEDSDPTPFQCDMCRITMKSIQDLIGHIKWLHNSWQHSTWLVDRRTNLKFSKEGLLKGKSIIPEQRHLCTWCTFKSKSRQRTEEHLRTCHPNVDPLHGMVTFHEEPRPIFADLNGREKENALLPTNTQNMEPNNFEESPLLTNEDILPLSPPNSPPDLAVILPLPQSQKIEIQYVCHLCPKSFGKEILFRIHLAQHGGFNCTTPLLTAWHVCRTCGYMAQSNSDFVQHTAQHLSERRFACSHCDSDSHTKGGMISHIRKVHNNAREVTLIDRREFSMNVEIQPMAVDLDPKLKVVDIYRT